MKKIAIILTLLLCIVGLSFQNINGQSKKSTISHHSISHTKDNDKETFVKSDASGTTIIERNKGRLVKLNINGKEISEEDFADYAIFVENALSNIPSPPQPPAPINENLIPPMPALAPMPPMPPLFGSLDFEEDFGALNEEDFEATIEAQAEERKHFLQEMYEEKARTLNEIIEEAQSRKHN